MTTPLFSDEVQLAGWSDSHTSGAKVTFWLSDPALLEPFRGMTERKGKTAGQRLAMVLVEIGDDEKPVPQPDKPKEPIGELCRLAVMWCKDEQFQRWVQLRGINRVVDGNNLPHFFGSGEDEAKSFILEFCGIGSRKELDTNTAAATKFHMGIRNPYMEYLKGLG